MTAPVPSFARGKKKAAGSAEPGTYKEWGPDIDVLEIVKKCKASNYKIIRGKVLEMDPGSKAARYWAGFGAGAARAKIEGALKGGGTAVALLAAPEIARFYPARSRCADAYPSILTIEVSLGPGSSSGKSF